MTAFRYEYSASASLFALSYSTPLLTKSSVSTNSLVPGRNMLAMTIEQNPIKIENVTRFIDQVTPRLNLSRQIKQIMASITASESNHSELLLNAKYEAVSSETKISAPLRKITFLFSLDLAAVINEQIAAAMNATSAGKNIHIAKGKAGCSRISAPRLVPIIWSGKSDRIS